MTLPQKESPAEGQGLDLVGSGDLNTIYGSAGENATADVAMCIGRCHSCAAFVPYEPDHGACHRYAPKPNYDRTLFVEWPRVAGNDFCLEYVSKGGE